MRKSRIKRGYDMCENEDDFTDAYSHTFMCSRCKNSWQTERNGTNYCPICGARIVKNPSDQPNIIRCKECRSYDNQTFYEGHGWCNILCTATQDDFYCGWAERRA